MTTTAPPTSRLDVYRKYVAWIESTCASDPGARVALRRGCAAALTMFRVCTASSPSGCPRGAPERRNAPTTQWRQ